MSLLLVAETIEPSGCWLVAMSNKVSLPASGVFSTQFEGSLNLEFFHATVFRLPFDVRGRLAEAIVGVHSLQLLSNALEFVLLGFPFVRNIND